MLSSLPMDPRPVGMFDSGAGGLSVLRPFMELAPNERVIYFADTAFFPYGPRPAAEVRKRSFAIVHRLQQAGVKMVVVACNTASSAALSDLREGFPDLPFVGMVPGLKPAAQRSRSGVVAVLATPGTLDGELLARVREEFGRGTNVIQVPGDGLAAMVEHGETGTPRIRQRLHELLDRPVEKGADTVVLGCTHYHFLDDDLRDEFPGLELVDTSEAVARRAVAVLAEKDLQAPPGQPGELDLIVSGDHAAFYAVMDHLGFHRASEGVA